VFVRSPAEGAFHQGEILSDVIQLCALLDSLSPESEGLEFDEVRHPFAVVLTQECDLDWDFKARTVEPDESKRQLKISPNVLFCELFPESVIRPRVPKGSEMWKRITNNQDQRYHTITPVPSGLDRAALGLPMLIADFKQVFAVRTDELYHRLGLELRRRTIIQVPWVQDLSNRFSYYFERVALPEGTSNQIALPASSASTGGSEIGFWRRLARRLPFRLL
jgi:hypothetical protein